MHEEKMNLVLFLFTQYTLLRENLA